MMEGLQKAKITPYGQNKKALESITVMFNPEQYTLSKSNNFASIAIPGRESPVIQYVKGESETFSIELFYDTYMLDGQDVTSYTDKISNLMAINSDLHAPPVCKFEWGGFSFTGVIDKVDRKFTMFSEKGVPVRAILTVSFKQFTNPERSKFSPDRTKRRIVQEGDALWLIAVREYGDPEKWKEIAKANKIENPRLLKIGMHLIIPPLE